MNALLHIRELLRSALAVNDQLVGNRKPAEFGRLLVTIFGAMYELTILNEAVRIDFWKRRTTIDETHQSLMNGTFEILMKTAMEQTSAYSGVSPHLQRQTRLRQLGNLPSPLELVRWLSICGQHPVPEEIVNEWGEKEKRCKTLLFQMLDSDELQELSNEQQAELEQFLLSKAAYWSAGKPISWYQVVCDFGQDCQNFAGRVQRVKGCLALTSLLQPAVSLSFPVQTSFRDYLADRTMRAISASLEIEFPPQMEKALSEILTVDEQARCDLGFSIFQPQFIRVENFPEESPAAPFVAVLQCFLHFRERAQAVPQGLLEWIYDAFSDDRQQLAMIEDPQRINQATLVFETLSKGAEIPRDRILKIVVSLARLKNTNSFMEFLHTVDECRLFPVDSDFLAAFLSSHHNPDDYTPYAAMVRGFAAILKNFKVKGHPNKASFWVRIFRLRIFGEAEIEIFLKSFATRVDQVEDETFYLMMMRFFEGKITPYHVECLGISLFPVATVDFVSILATQNTELENTPSRVYLNERLALVKAIESRWGLTRRMSGILYFEFLKLTVQEIQKQAHHLTLIEEYVNMPLRREQSFCWLRYHPNLVQVEEVLARFFELRKELVLLNLDNFVIPKSLYSRIGKVFAAVSLIPSSIPDTDNSEYLQAIAAIGTLLQRSTLPTSPHPWAEFIHFDAARDRPFECGEEHRVMAYPGLLSPFFHHHPSGPAILRRWHLPQNPDNAATYELQIMRVETCQTYRIRATLAIPWKEIQEDSSILQIVCRVATTMGEEASYSPDIPTEDPGFEDFFPLYPRCAEVWEKYQPNSYSKELLGKAAFEFVMQLKIGYRKALLSLVTPVETEMFNLAVSGHIYPVFVGLSLYPPHRFLTEEMEKNCTIRRECDEIIQTMGKGISTHHPIETIEFPFDKGELDVPLRFQFDPKQVDDHTFLNEVTLELGGWKSMIRYGSLIDEQEYFPLLLKRQILELLSWQ